VRTLLIASRGCDGSGAAILIDAIEACATSRNRWNDHYLAGALISKNSGETDLRKREKKSFYSICGVLKISSPAGDVFASRDLLTSSTTSVA
jgi:hypothetical protein